MNLDLRQIISSSSSSWFHPLCPLLNPIWHLLSPCTITPSFDSFNIQTFWSFLYIPFSTSFYLLYSNYIFDLRRLHMDGLLGETSNSWNIIAFCDNLFCYSWDDFYRLFICIVVGEFENVTFVFEHNRNVRDREWTIS